MGLEDQHRPSLWAPLAVVATTAVGIAATRLSDPDLGFHLATGREVLSTGEIPATNVLSYAATEHAWLVHEWLPAAAFELIYQASGSAGLVLLQAALIAACWVLVFLAARRQSQTDWPAAVATVVALAAASSRLNLRPHLITALLLAGLVFLCTSDDRPRWQSALAVGATLAVGYQLHAGALFLVLFVLAVTVGHALDAKLRSAAVQWKPYAVGLVGGGLAAALLLASYHPYGLAVLTVPFDLAGSGDLTNHVIEYRGIWRFSFERLPFFWLFLACMVPTLLWGARRAPAWLMLGTGGMLFMAVRHVRVIDSAAVVAAPLLALAIAAVAQRASDSVRRTLPLLAALIGLAAVFVRWGHTPPGLTFDSAVFADRAFDYVDRRGLQGRAYLTNGWAGPYLGRYYPGQRVFFDPRFEAYPPEFVRTYKEIRYGEARWRELLNEYDVEIMILKYTSPGEAELQNGRHNVRQLLVADPGWMLVYFDDDGEVFVRIDGVNAGVARADGIPAVEPDGIQFLGDPADSLALLQRVLERDGASLRLLKLLVGAAKAADRPELAAQYAEQAARLR